MADNNSIDDFVGDVIRAHDEQESRASAPTMAAQRSGAAESVSLGVLPGHAVERLIARGGMGAVYLAQQHALEREVAVKVMTRDAESPEMAARFRREALVLGRLAHPNIVPVYDVGTDDEGQLFYTMKLVKGRTLQHLLNDLRREDGETLKEHTLTSLLTVFRKVCDAMAFAHSQGIIHRDLKPENIMVGEFGEVLVMDWGLAKTIRLSDKETIREGERDESVQSNAAELGADADSLNVDHRLLNTLQGQVMGTPQYMSPEQARGEIDALDEQSDVFSLGGILYAILTLRAPVEGNTSQEVLEKVKSGEITTPTDLVGGNAKPRTGEVLEAKAVKPLPHTATGRVPVALSAVAMKALALKKEDRYPNVGALSRDLAAYQGGFATTAEQAGLATQVMLLIKRNRILVGGVTAVIVTLSLGLAVSMLLLLRERDARALADAESAKSREVSEFLKETLASVEASTAMGRDTTLMKEILDKTADRIGDRLANRPQVEAELRVVIGETYQDISEFEKAIGHHQRAVVLFRQIHEGDHPDLAGALLGLGSALEFEGRVREAEPHVRAALEMRERLFPADDPAVAEAHILWAWVLQKSGRSKESLESAQIGFDAWRKHPELVLLEAAPRTLAVALAAMGRLAESEAVYQEEWRTLKQLFGDEHPSIGTCLDNLGMTLVRLRKFDEAEPVLQEALAQGRKFYGDRCHHEDHVLAHLAQIAAHRGEDAEQLRLLRDGVAVSRRVYKEGHRYRKEALGHLLKALQSQMKKFLESDVPGDAEKAAACREELEALAQSQNEVKVEIP